MPEAELTRFRRQTVRFVFQTFNLIPNLSAIENVMLPMEFTGVPAAERGSRPGRPGAHGARRAAQPSAARAVGGEPQRVAIARALANEPPLVLADEPTGNLDSTTGQMIYELLAEIARERTVVVVTHAELLAQMASGVLHIKDGRLADGAR